MPAMATMSPASATVDSRALQAAEGQHLGDACRLDQAAFAAQRLDGLVGRMLPEVMRPVRMRPR
jgi:hypothetical protein